MQNIDFFATRQNMVVNFGSGYDRAGNVNYPYTYHWSIFPIGIVLTIRSSEPLYTESMGPSSLNLEDNIISLPDYTFVSEGKGFLEIGTPVKRIVTISGSGGYSTLYYNQIEAVSANGDWYKGKQANGFLSDLGYGNYRILWPGTSSNPFTSINSMLSIDTNLGHGETKAYENNAAFSLRYPIVKIGQGDSGYYVKTTSAVLNVGTTYTFLTMIGNIYSHTNQGEFLNDYATNINLAAGNKNTLLYNSEPQGTTPATKPLNYNSSTKDIGGMENEGAYKDSTSAGPGQVDRRVMPSYGVETHQMSAIASSYPNTPTGYYYIKKGETAQENLPKTQTFSRQHPLVLWTNKITGEVIDNNEIFGLDPFHIRVKEKTWRIPYNGTIRRYHREVSSITRDQAISETSLFEASAHLVTVFNKVVVIVEDSLSTSSDMFIDSTNNPINVYLPSPSAEEYSFNRFSNLPEQIDTTNLWNVTNAEISHQLTLNYRGGSGGALWTETVDFVNQQGTVVVMHDNAFININYIVNNIPIIPGIGDVNYIGYNSIASFMPDGTVATNYGDTRDKTNLLKGDTTSKDGHLEMYLQARSGTGTNKQYTEIRDTLKGFSHGIVPSFNWSLVRNPQNKKITRYAGLNDYNTVDLYVDIGASQNSNGTGNCAGFSASINCTSQPFIDFVVAYPEEN